MRGGGGGEGRGGRVDSPCSSFALVFNSDLAQKGNKSHQFCTGYFPRNYTDTYFLNLKSLPS